MAPGNILFITIDQLRADVISGPLAPFIPTPNIDRLAALGCLFENHYTVTVPCGPARASLLTGLYAMNHRSIRNGTPLAAHHVTVATEMRKSGYEPLLFGYTDTTPDPGGMDVQDPALASYEGVAPGFREIVEMRQETGFEWPAWLRARGHDFTADDHRPVPDLYRPPAARANAPDITAAARYGADESDTAYLTDRTLAALAMRTGKPWFAHVSYVRPHPPFIAPSPYNVLIDPQSLPAARGRAPDHAFMRAWFSQPSNEGLFWGFDGDCASLTPQMVRELRAVYGGLVAEVDHHVGRLLDWLEETDQAGRTLVVLTADHGDMLGDMGLWGKQSVFEAAYRVPLIVRDPAAARRGAVVTRFTESVDVAPTILRFAGRAPPPAMDGVALQPLIDGEASGWREFVMMEIDLARCTRRSRFQRYFDLPEQHCNATIVRDGRWKYVHFGGGVPAMLFDLAADPDETHDLGGETRFSNERLRLASLMLDRMMERRDRRLTGFSFGQD